MTPPLQPSVSEEPHFPKGNGGGSWDLVPRGLRAEVEAALHLGERIICWVENDLDANLRYSSGLLVLTDVRLLFSDGVSPLQAWGIDSGVALANRDLTGTGMLELRGGDGTIVSWRYTGGKRGATLRLLSRFERRIRGDDEEEELPEIFSALCSDCGKPLGPDHDLCPQCEAARSKQAFKSLWRLLAFAKSRRSVIALGLLLQFLSTAAGLIPPYLTIPMIDDVLVPYQSGMPVAFELVWFYLLGLFGAQLLSWLLSWGRTWVLAWASERIAADLRTTTYAHLQSLSLEFFGGRRTGELISRVSGDTDRICYFLSVHLLDFVNDVLMIAMTAGILIYIDPQLALITLVPLPFIALLVHKVRRRLVEGFTQGSRAWGEMTNVLADTIPGIRVVKAFAQEKREVARFREVNNLVLQANDRVNKLWSFFSSVVTFLTGVGVLVVWGFGAWLVFHSGVKVGVLTGFVQYISRFYGRMDSMSRMVSAFQRAGVASQRVFSILDRVPDVPDPKDPVHPGRLKGEVELRGVSFHYGPRQVLRDLNLHIKPGEMIGLVGQSGAGKSTLINLICRFYDVKDGAIFVDGNDIRAYPAEEYRQNIGIVLQEPFLFYGSIADNIGYGRPSARRGELVEAARAARAHEFILKLADGYDSLVGERGQSLSGGERQRISIARALLINPAILVLDEATSSVDTKTEREIQRAVENLVRGRTTIAIAHRLSTLRRADRIVVMEHGRIARIVPPGEVVPEGAESGGEERGSAENFVIEDEKRLKLIRLHRDSFGRLNVEIPGGDLIQDVAPVRAFPLSAPHEWVSLVRPDGSEVVAVRNLDSLAVEVRSILEEELSHREFVPVITKIVSAETRSTPLEWNVITDRGPTTFYLESDEDMRRLSPRSAIFVDTHGIRYLIKDFTALDSQSRRILSKFF